MVLNTFCTAVRYGLTNAASKMGPPPLLPVRFCPRFFDGLLELVRGEGLNDVVVHPSLDGLDDAVFLCFRGDHDEGYLLYGLVFLACLQELYSRHLRHDPVAH